MSVKVVQNHEKHKEELVRGHLKIYCTLYRAKKRNYSKTYGHTRPGSHFHDLLKWRKLFRMAKNITINWTEVIPTLSSLRKRAKMRIYSRVWPLKPLDY